jgi:hypothetical protein
MNGVFNVENMTASDFRGFKVCDGLETCCSCRQEPPRCYAPVIIKGKHYCLWCALQIARELLARDIVTVQQIASVGELTEFLKS